MFQQFSKISFSIKIKSVIRRVLCNEQQLFGSTARKVLCFLHHFLDGARDMFATHQRNRTNRTRTVTPLWNVEVRIMTRICKDTFADKFLLIVCAESFQNS